MKSSLPLLLLLLGVVSADQVKAAGPPNILFIYTDDHSHRTVSCYDESYHQRL